MPQIVGVHGIGQQYSGGYALATRWLDAVRDGLVAADHPELATSLNSGSLRVVFFGDLFRPRGAMDSALPPYTHRDIAEGFEQDLLASWYQSLTQVDATTAPAQDHMAPTPVPVQIMLARILNSKIFAGVAERLFIGNLKQVSRYLNEPATKESVLSRFSREVANDTVAIIAHSLGSVVAYEFLCKYQPSNVKLLMTLGSPLGLPNIIFDRLTPSPRDGFGAWPGDVISWVNVADKNDIVAMHKKLRTLFPAPEGRASVSDEPVDNGWHAHDAERYINSTAVGAALAQCIA